MPFVVARKAFDRAVQDLEKCDQFSDLLDKLSRFRAQHDGDFPVPLFVKLMTRDRMALVDKLFLREMSDDAPAVPGVIRTPFGPIAYAIAFVCLMDGGIFESLGVDPRRFLAFFSNNAFLTEGKMDCLERVVPPKKEAKERAGVPLRKFVELNGRLRLSRLTPKEVFAKNRISEPAASVETFDQLDVDLVGLLLQPKKRKFDGDGKSRAKMLASTAYEQRLLKNARRVRESVEEEVAPRFSQSSHDDGERPSRSSGSPPPTKRRRRISSSSSSSSSSSTNGRRMASSSSSSSEEGEKRPVTAPESLPRPRRLNRLSSSSSSEDEKRPPRFDEALIPRTKSDASSSGTEDPDYPVPLPTRPIGSRTPSPLPRTTTAEWGSPLEENRADPEDPVVAETSETRFQEADRQDLLDTPALPYPTEADLRNVFVAEADDETFSIATGNATASRDLFSGEAFATAHATPLLFSGEAEVSATTAAPNDVDLEEIEDILARMEGTTLPPPEDGAERSRPPRAASDLREPGLDAAPTTSSFCPRVFCVEHDRLVLNGRVFMRLTALRVIEKGLTTSCNIPLRYQEWSAKRVAYEEPQRGLGRFVFTDPDPPRENEVDAWPTLEVIKDRREETGEERWLRTSIPFLSIPPRLLRWHDVPHRLTETLQFLPVDPTREPSPPSQEDLLDESTCLHLSELPVVPTDPTEWRFNKELAASAARLANNPNHVCHYAAFFFPPHAADEVELRQLGLATAKTADSRKRQRRLLAMRR